MASQEAIRETILGLEREYWEAMKARDGKAAARLTADECIVAGPHGVSEVDSDSIVGMVEQGSFELKEYSLDEKSARFSTIGRNVAILAYPVHEQMMRDGKAATLDAFDLSVWVRRNGGWVCAAHTETIAGEH
jgi:ketosteroid isomerase-like protein